MIFFLHFWGASKDFCTFSSLKKKLFVFDFFECFISLYFIFLFASRKQPLHWYRRTAATINIFYSLLSAPAFYFCCCTALKYARIFLSSFAFSLLLTQGHTIQKQKKKCQCEQHMSLEAKKKGWIWLGKLLKKARAPCMKKIHRLQAPRIHQKCRT